MATREKGEKRAYRQGARAEDAKATAERILDATMALLGERWLDELTLEELAARAEVNVRTVLRRFGTRDGVVEAALERYRERLQAGPLGPTPGDARAAVRALVDYYEREGTFLLRGLAQEERFAFLRAGFEGTRARHRAWLAKAFAPQLAAFALARRALKLTELAAVTWAPTWRFLRYESGLGRDDAELALRDLVRSVVTPRPRVLRVRVGGALG